MRLLNLKLGPVEYSGVNGACLVQTWCGC